MSDSPAIRGLVVAVGDWYARTLEVCLVRNMRHLTSCLVVTAPGDPCALVARGVPGTNVLETDAFTRHGARFNKGLAIEEALDAMGRLGWILIHDADVLLPDDLPTAGRRRNALHGARRRVLADPSRWHPGFPIGRARPHYDNGPIGFFQLFHADSIHLRDRRPWYDVSFAHAGGGDAYFLSLFPAPDRVMLPCQVLHLGPTDSHWFGADPASKDMMSRFVLDCGWRRAARDHDPEAAARSPEAPHRVAVPGYEPSGFELPFVRRARLKAANPPRSCGSFEAG